jgi:2-haloacid dehalogenase
VPVPIGPVRACVFDAYGTLLDTGAPIAAEAAALGPLAAELAALWRRKQLEYTWLRSLMRRHADFETVTADALDHSLEALGVADPALRARLLAAYRRLTAFADVLPALRGLLAQGMRTAILSNATPGLLADGLAAAGLADLVDPVLSVEEVGVFKPAPEVYRLATSRLGLAAAEIAFVSANGWDVHGAASFGLRSIWVDRGRVARERLPGSPARVIQDLTGLPAMLRAVAGGAP